MEERSDRCYVVALKMEEGGHEPRIADGLLKLETARTRTLSCCLQRGTQPC